MPMITIFWPAHFRRASFLLVSSLFLLSLSAQATHIRAGEITARRIDPQSFTYEITLHGYADQSSAVLFGSNGTLDFGDGTILVINNQGTDIPRTLVSPDTWQYTFKVIHTYSSAGTYSVSFREFYRNDGTLNMDNPVQTPFYLETILVIDPFLGPNSTPTFKRPPIDRGILGLTYHHQPGAMETDGDSLAYRLIPSRQDRTYMVHNFRYPHRTFPLGDARNGSTETGETPYFRINPLSGDVVWDAPGTEGEYNFALLVEEWRKVEGEYYLIGSVTRDMQIIVETPEEIAGLQFPINGLSTAPAPGEAIQWQVSATAPTPSDSIVLEIWGDFADRSGASLSARQVRALGEANITITWTGEEDLGQHYQLIAKAYDPLSPQLARNRAAYVYQNLRGPLGISENRYTPLRIYPNPLQGNNCAIYLPEAAGKEVRLQLLDVRGRLVQQETVATVGQEIPFRLAHHAPGLYVLHLYVDGRRYRGKLVIQ
ncbi:hypothetical protein ADICEAN_04080 [Cesiribacter andamanensis AMV16]|uniref:Secretion system C-terminal sorting domain-containing protein n=1 Tax=Cesiribacter andamanensis AMV16 TaxID=1279009 RepID=M7NG66_9BACT|nr:hypothetical protein ADICEAN_04080 [Cesiribacter andamanensis AMV16]